MSAEVIRFSPALYSAKGFTANVGNHSWKFSGTLCGGIDIATPAGTFCMTPDELLSVVNAMKSAREDVLANSCPNRDPRIIG